jgi:hypothetical protein
MIVRENTSIFINHASFEFKLGTNANKKAITGTKQANQADILLDYSPKKLNAEHGEVFF